MGKALEILSGRVTAPGATLTAVTMAAGNSLQIRNAPFDSDIRLLVAWSDNQAAGTLQIRSPKLHDNVRGLRYRVNIGEVQPLMPIYAQQRLYAQDQLTVELSGSAVAGDIEQMAMLVYYANLPGTEARLATLDDILRRMVNLVTVENTITALATGGYTGEEAINAESDLLKANTDYALLGYVVDVECAAVRWRGVDTGNLGLGGPGEPGARDLTSRWFCYLSTVTGLPLIPVFNSANKGGILIDVAQDENAGAVLVSSTFAELAPGAAAPAR